MKQLLKGFFIVFEFIAWALLSLFFIMVEFLTPFVRETIRGLIRGIKEGTKKGNIDVVLYVKNHSLPSLTEIVAKFKEKPNDKIS